VFVVIVMHAKLGVVLEALDEMTRQRERRREMPRQRRDRSARGRDGRTTATSW